MTSEHKFVVPKQTSMTFDTFIDTLHIENNIRRLRVVASDDLQAETKHQAPCVSCVQEDSDLGCFG